MKRFPKLSFSLDFLEEGQDLSGAFICPAGEVLELEIHTLDSEKRAPPDEVF
ncbi:MAG: hypothetical protein VYD19_06720 [Myxococcota bacterium]|nr:hypothetical protein [Myxococcota bacterium]